MNDIITKSLEQLLPLTPILLVCLTGVVLARKFSRRCPTPSFLVMVASLLFLLVTAANPFVYNYFYLVAQTTWGWDRTKLEAMGFGIALTSSCLRAAALGTLLASVFLGRNAPQSNGPNQSPETPRR